MLNLLGILSLLPPNPETALVGLKITPAQQLMTVE